MQQALVDTDAGVVVVSMELEDTDAGVVVVSMEKGGAAYRSLLVRKGLVIKQIVVGSVRYRIENAADCSSKL